MENDIDNAVKNVMNVRSTRGCQHQSSYNHGRMHQSSGNNQISAMMSQDVFYHCGYLFKVARSIHLKLPLLKTLNGQKCFSYRGARLWNNLSAYVKRAQTQYQFKIYKISRESFL